MINGIMMQAVFDSPITEKETQTERVFRNAATNHKIHDLIASFPSAREELMRPTNSGLLRKGH
jgi:hypothetical protein